MEFVYGKQLKTTLFPSEDNKNQTPVVLKELTIDAIREYCSYKI